MEIMIWEMGKFYWQGCQEIEFCVGICEYIVQFVFELLQDEEWELFNGGNGLVIYSFIGVVYGIQFWNFLVYQVICYVVVSFMVGNGVLFKYVENVIGFVLLFEKLF